MKAAMKATRSQAQAVLQRTRGWSPGKRYLAATALVVVTALVRWLLSPWLHDYNYFLFDFAVAISAIFLDTASSIWATLLSAVFVTYWFVGPPDSFDLVGSEVVALLIFIFVCLVLSMSAELMRGVTDELYAAHEEKDMLYRELHHRTRNNLQIINTTIALQLRSAKSPEVRANLEEVAERITGFARMEGLLHRAGTSGMLDARDYFSTLTGDLQFSLAARRPVTIECEADSCPISYGVAETLGIALNELVTNALKHAFPEDTPGNLDVRFEAADREFVLTVRDNGKGCRPEAVEGTGWRIINSVVRRYRGTMTIHDADPGCCAVLRLPRETTADES
jgi:two-component system, sensor histidine kinase PdtaS